MASAEHRIIEWRRTCRSILVGYACLFVSLGSGAQDVTLNLKEAQITALIDTVAEITGKNFIVDPSVEGLVTVISSTPLSSATVYDVFLSVLQVHGYAAIETPNAVKILPLDRAKAQSRFPPNGESEEFVTQVFEVRRVQAEQLVPILRPLIATEGHIAASRDSNRLIITDRAVNVARLRDVINRIDTPARDGFEVLQLQRAIATDVERIVRDMMGITGGPNDRAKIRADRRSNSVLIRGDEEAVTLMRAMIVQLDSRQVAEGSTEVMFLRHAVAADMVAVLEGVLESSTAGTTDLNRARIQADPSVNALIISGPPEVMQTLAVVIDKLDVPRRQVQVEAIIAEVAADRAAELGIQWRSTEEPDGRGVIGGTNFNVTGQGVNQVSVDPTIIGDGLSLGFLDGGVSVLGTEILNIGALLRALAADSNTNVLSTPSLVTVDNEEASIVVGQNVPFITGQFVSTGAAQGAENPFQTIEREDVGIQLRVRPQINEGERVLLEIAQEVSSISPATTTVNASDLVTERRSITTSVLVDDGNIVVLGGLIEEDVQEDQQRVPVLGSLPLLGRLFRYDSTSKVKRNLMVFLTPTILTDGETYARVTQERYESVREDQLQRQPEGVELLPEATQPLLPPVATP